MPPTLEWDTHPDDFEVVDLAKTRTRTDGKPCQVMLTVQFKCEGADIGEPKSQAIGPGNLGNHITKPIDWNPNELDEDGTAVNSDGDTVKGTYTAYQFKKLWDSVPEVPQVTKDAVKAKLPLSLVKELWRN